MTETLATALEREHREIDGGIEQYLVGADSGAQSPEPLTRALAGLRRHIYLEEEFLFPPLRAAGMMMPIFVMLREHGELWHALDGIDQMLANGTALAEVSSACRELLTMLDKHNAKEEPVIYAQADATLTIEATGELSAFLSSGQMPAGWLCHGARS